MVEPLTAAARMRHPSNLPRSLSCSMLHQTCRCASAAGVCRRWHEVCTGPELLARVDVCTWGSRTRQRVERLQALFAWLATRAAPHAHAVCLRLGCSTKLTDADAAQLRQAATAALASLQAATELRLELVRLSLPVDGWVAALPALRRLQFEQPCEGLALQAPWAEAAALQELTICGAPLQLLAEASLPPALTRLHLGALSRPWLPPQVGTGLEMLQGKVRHSCSAGLITVLLG